jgi:hypothetical protein
MGFWSDINMDPKRSFRWLFYIDSVAAPYLCRSVKKPSFSVGNISHQFVNHTFYYPGRVSWNPVDVSIVDPAGGGFGYEGEDTSVSLLNAIYASGYTNPDKGGPNGSISSISKKAANTYIGVPRIEQIDGDGEPIEEWTLHNAWIESADFGSLDYGSEEMVSLSMTLRYDWATMDNSESSRK